MFHLGNNNSNYPGVFNGFVVHMLQTIALVWQICYPFDCLKCSLRLHIGGVFLSFETNIYCFVFFLFKIKLVILNTFHFEPVNE